MSSIDKLLIEGVRSFSPKEHAVIEFLHPLTLIVGQNGSGKTSIIECLRYVTTGETPPNSKEGAFIHDPKLVGEREVRARIKLKFRDVNGDTIVATRNLQATQHAKKISQKQLEGVIQKIDRVTGEKTSISNKCAEMDTEMCSFLGVSPAILSNVIFCHQEESNWPLSEGKVLKQKFDDIFAATKYIKALESIKKFRTEQVAKCREVKVDLEHLQEKKEKVVQIRRDYDACLANIAEADKRIAEIADALRPVQHRLRELHEHGETILRYQRELASASSSRDALVKQTKNLEGSLDPKLVNLSEQQLQDRLHDMKTTASGKQEELREAEQKLQKIKQEGKKAQEEMSRLQGEKGQLAHAAQECVRKQQDRDTRISEVAGKYALPGVYRAPLDESQVSQFTASMAGLRDAAQATVERAKAAYREEQRTLQRSLDDIRAQHSQVSEALKHKEGALETAQERHRINQSKASALRPPTQSLESLQVEREAAEASAERCRAELQEFMRKDAVPTLEKDRNHLAFTLRKTREELERMQGQLRQRTLLESKVKAVAQKRAEQESIVALRQSDLRALFGSVPDAADASRLLQARLRELEGHLRQAQDKVSQLSQARAREQGSLEHVSAQVKEMERTLQGKQATVHAVTGGRAYEDVVQERRAALERARKEVDGAQGVIRVYRRLKKDSADRGCCALCDRTFASPGEMQALLDAMEDIIAGTPAREEQAKRKLAECEELYEQTTRVRSTVEEVEALEQTRLPALRAKHTDMARSLAALQAQLSDEAEVERATLAAELQAASELRGDCEKLERLAKEGRALEAEVARERLALQGEDARSMDEVNEEANTLSKQIEAINDEIERSKARRTRLERAAVDADRCVNELGLQILKAQQDMEAILKCKEEAARLEQEMGRLRTEIGELRRQREPLQGKLAEAVEAMTRAEREHQAAIASAEAAATRLGRDTEAITILDQDVQAHLRSGKDRQLQECERRMRAVEGTMREREEASVQQGKVVDQVKYEIANQQSLQRAVTDCLQVRDMRRQIEEAAGKVQSIQRELDALDQGGAYGKNRAVLEKERDRHLRDQAQEQGRKGSLEEQARAMKRELEGAFYRDTDEKHRNRLIELKTMEMANEDLNKYYVALDRAIMKYHAMKMEEINRLIKELWVKTYQGNDVDYIEIRTDVEEEAEDGARDATSKRRTYNYRVVMVKSDTALDMRGRCSAGQKVLASIIIRLALAETFCLNCGVMTLDEPTTNLDKENIESLAKALAEVIHHRRSQPNFQLIIITHDEDFVSNIGRKQIADHYFRVSRGPNRSSRIEKQSMDTLL